MEVSAERRFQCNPHPALKKRLDALHYAFPLSPESALLVERLLGDLLKTTEGFQQLKKQNTELQTRLKAAETGLEPLKRETSRLLRQNNELHLALMAAKEDCDARENSWRAAVKKLEGEASDLKFVVARCKEEIRAGEASNVGLREKLDVALARVYLPSTQKGLPPSQRAEGLGSTQSFELSRPLAAGGPPAAAFQRANAEWANELRVADERARRWQEELERAVQDKAESENEIARLRAQVAARDAEIRRVSAVAGEFNMDRLQAQYKDQTAAETIAALNERVDFLNAENLKLDQDLAAATQSISKSSSALQENRALVERVNQLRGQNKQLLVRITDLEAIGGQIRANEEQKVAALQVEELKNTVNSLKAELEALQVKDYSASQLQAAYNSDKKAFNEALEAVERQKIAAEGELAAAQTRLADLERQLSSAESEMSILRTQNANLGKQIEASRVQQAKISQESQSSMQDYYEFRQKVTELEAVRAEQHGEIANLRFEIERLARAKEAAEEHLAAVKYEMIKTRGDLEGLSAARQRSQLLLDSHSKEADVAKAETQRVLKLREEDKRAYLELEVRLREAQAEILGAKEQTRLVQLEHSQLSAELAARLEEMRRAEAARLEIERELAELRPLRGQWTQASLDLSRMRDASNEQAADAARRRREVEAAAQELSAKELRIQELSLSIERLGAEKAELAQQVAAAGELGYSAAATQKKAEQLEAELKQLRGHLESAREAERGYVRQVEQLRSEVQRESERAAGAQRQVERAAAANSELGAQLAEVRGNLSAAQGQESQSRSERLVLEEQRLQVGLQAGELRRQLAAEQQQRFQLEDQCTRLSDKIKQLELDNVAACERSEHLKTFAASLEQLKAELLDKLRRSQESATEAEGRQQELYQEMARLRAQLGEESAVAGELKEALRDLDRQRDHAQGLLDQRSEELAAAEAAARGHHSQAAQLQDNLLQAQEQAAQQLQRLQAKDEKLRSLTETSAAQQQQIAALEAANRELGRSAHEFQDAIQSLTKENQHIGEQLVRVGQERDRLDQHSAEHRHAERVAQQHARDAKRENEDLRLTYAKACEENERLTQSLSAISDDHGALLGRAHAADSEVVAAQRHIAQLESAVAGYQGEIQALQGQVSAQSARIEQAERRMREAQEAKEEALRGYSTARHFTAEVEHSRDEYQRQIAELQHEASIQIGQLRALQNELAATQSQLEFERQRYSDIEHVLARERETSALLEHELNRRDEQRSLLKDTSRSSYESPLRQEMWQEKIEEHRTQILNLEMERLRMQDDYAQTRHRLDRSEARVQELEGMLGRTPGAD